MFSGRKNPSGPWIVAGITLAALLYAGYYGATTSGATGWGRNFGWGRSDRQRPAEFKVTRFSEPFTASVHRAALNIEGGATTYILNNTTSNLFEAEVKHQFVKYSLTRTTRDSVEVLSLKVPDSITIRGPHNFNLNKVDMKLNTSPLWDITLKMGAGKADFNLTPFKIGNLNIEGGAAAFKIRLGELQMNSTVTVKTGVSEVEIFVPRSVGCIINVDSGLSSNTFEGFDKQDDGTFITPNYTTAAKKISINLEGGVSDFEVMQY